MRVKTMKTRIEALTAAAAKEKDKARKGAMQATATHYGQAIEALANAGKALKDGGITLFDTPGAGAEDK